ncbi:MAG: RecX family transcriptional regulator [Anaerolineae bacterium]|nr:RecX family transcriptional regulator [Anaerolineae bacterium]
MVDRKITALKRQKKNQERVSVYLDGEFAFGLPEDAAIALRTGQTLSEAEIAALQDKDRFARLRDQATHYLSYRPRSVAEVRRHFLRKGHEEALVERVIAYLSERALLDDEAFARYWVEQRETFKPRSRLALRQELYKRGVDAAAIDAAIDDVDELAAARRAAEKLAWKWRGLDYDRLRAKLGGYLQRRGFGYDIVRLIVEETWADSGADETAT